MNKYQKYLSLKKTIGEKKLDEIGDIQKLLCADVWNMIALTKKDELIRIVAILLSDIITVKEFEDSQDSSHLAVEIEYPKTAFRKDNQQIFDNLYEYLKPARHYGIIKNYKINIFHLVYKVKRLLRYKKFFKNLRSIDASYLAAQLLIAEELVRKCNFFENKRIMIIFQEDDLISSTLCQTAQRKGVIVVTPQHGMPMNRHEDIDQLHFDGFLADHKLLWNEATREQFLSAGIDISRLEVVGNTKKIDNDDIIQLPKRNNAIGLLLDCPDYSYAYDTNYQMIRMAEQLCVDKNTKLLIKAHPRDDIIKYSKFSDKIQFLPLNISMDEFANCVSISIGHTTGAIFDLIYEGKIVFQFVDDKKFPVETLSSCKFSNERELFDIYNVWDKNWESLIKEYIVKVVPRYHVKNARELHNLFFANLFKEIGS